jgi:hypothetical protein
MSLAYGIADLRLLISFLGPFRLMILKPGFIVAQTGVKID